MKFTVKYKLVAAILVGNGVGGRMATAPHYSTNRKYNECNGKDPKSMTHGHSKKFHI